MRFMSINIIVHAILSTYFGRCRCLINQTPTPPSATGQRYASSCRLGARPPTNTDDLSGETSQQPEEMPLDCLNSYSILIIMTQTIKIALYQGFHGQGMPDSIAEQIKQAKPEILCLPEYFMVGPDELSILPSADRHNKHLKYLKRLSIRLNCAIAGGTLLRWTNNEYKNTCYLISNGSVLGFYEKIHLYKHEGKGLVSPGYEYRVIRLNNIRVGLLVCADVLYAGTFSNLKGLRPDIVVIPVTAPYRKHETVEKKFARDQKLFVDGAKIVGCPVIKISSVGKIAGHRVQGRSLVAAPNGIIFRVPPGNEDKPVFKIIDLAV